MYGVWFSFPRRYTQVSRAVQGKVELIERVPAQVHALHHLSTVSIAGHNRQIIPKYKINYAVVPARRPFSPLTSGFHCNYFPMDPATSTSPRINIALALSISKGSPAYAHGIYLPRFSSAVIQLHPAT